MVANDEASQFSSAPKDETLDALGSSSTKAGDIVEEEIYVNPLENTSRWSLSARAIALRSGANIGFGLLNMTALPSSKVIRLDSTLSSKKGKGKIKVVVWEPASAEDEVNLKRPAVINFHGGGFVLGHSTDDAFWAEAVLEACGAVVFSVDYRLAPEYPYPIPVEDCADAILQIHQRSEEFGLDPDRIIVSGFSAGATLALASWTILQNPSRWDYQLPTEPPSIIGFVLFYPLLDWSTSRAHKRLKCAKPELTLPKSLTDLFDVSYIYPSLQKEKRIDPRLSPGLMQDDVLDRMPPLHLCICEYDMLQEEAHNFADRLKNRGKSVGVRVVEKEKHAWDKPPPLSLKPSVHIEYSHAVEAVKSWLGPVKE